MNTKYLHGVVILLFFAALTFSSAAQEIPPNSNLLRVMSYNIHHGNPPEKENLIDIEGTARVIKNQKVDIAAIQEVDMETKRSGKINQGLVLAQKSGLPYFYFGKAMDYDGGKYGVLILSKYPLSDTTTYSLPTANIQKDEPRVLAVARITLPNGKELRFGSTHLEAYNKEGRIQQAIAITKIAKTTTIPLIIAGDFNCKEGSETLNIIDTTFSRTCYNCPSTFWEGGETGAIDFITFFPRETFKVLKHDVVQNKENSDHMPVVAELEF